MAGVPIPHDIGFYSILFSKRLNLTDSPKRDFLEKSFDALGGIRKTRFFFELHWE